MSRGRKRAPLVAETSAPSRREPWWRESAPLVALLAFVAGLPTLRFGFVWDDSRLIVHNDALGSWAGLRDALFADFWVTSGPNASGFWRPLVTLTYASDRFLFRGAPWGFHLVNVLLGALAAALVAALARRLGAGRVSAALAGAWWALMPSHVESVAWIAGRTDVLATLFTLLALLLDRRARERGASWPGAGALAAAALALLAKEAALLLPLFVLALERVERERRGHVLRWVAPYAVVVVLYAAAHRLIVPGAPPPPYLGPEMLARGRLASALALPGYLGFLSPFGPHTAATLLASPASAADPRVLGGVALHALAFAALAWTLVRRSPFAVALVLFWGGLLPPILANLAQAYLLYSERFLYLPSVGAAWALALLLERTRPPWRAVAVAASLALVAASGVATWRTLPDWRDDESLFESMTRKGPRNAQGWTQLARLRLVQGHDAEAEQALARANALQPGRPEIVSLRALVHYRRGEWPAVLALADSAIALDPALPEPRLSRATALLRLGRLDEAGEEIATLRTRMPDNATVLGLEGQRLTALHRAAEALPLLRRATAGVSDDPDLFYALGMANAYQSQVSEARAAFERAVAIDPRFYDAWLRLATACQLLGDASARDAALARAAALPDAADGRVAELTRRLAAMSAARP